MSQSAIGADLARALEQMSLLMWRERETMDELHYRFGLEQMVLASGHLDWVARASRDIEAVLAQWRDVEALRIIATQEATTLLGLDMEVPLSEFARACPEPWNSIFDEHRQAFITSTQRISEATARNRDLLASGQRAIRETLLGIGGEPVVEYGQGPRPRQASSAYLDQRM